MAQVAKTIEISEETALQLAEMAAVRGTTEDTLIEEGLGLLFRDHAGTLDTDMLAEFSPDERASLGADIAALPEITAQPVNWDGAKVLTGSPVPSGQLRRSECLR